MKSTPKSLGSSASSRHMYSVLFNDSCLYSSGKPVSLSAINLSGILVVLILDALFLKSASCSRTFVSSDLSVDLSL